MQARVGPVSDLLGWVKGLQGRSLGPNAESSLAAQQVLLNVSINIFDMMHYNLTYYRIIFIDVIERCLTYAYMYFPFHYMVFHSHLTKIDKNVGCT